MKNDYVIRAAKDFAHRIVSETNDFMGTYLFSYGKNGLRMSNVSSTNKYVLDQQLRLLAKNSLIDGMVILHGAWTTDSSDWDGKSCWISELPENLRKSAVLIVSNTPTESVCYSYVVDNYSLTRESRGNHVGLFNNIYKRNTTKEEMDVFNKRCEASFNKREISIVFSEESHTRNSIYDIERSKIE